MKGSSQKHTEQTVPSAVPEAQFQKLVEVISRSQQNYRELIDHLDQAVFTLALDGEVRVANRRLAEILSVSFSDLIGHQLSEFIEAPDLGEVEGSIPGFLKRSSWSGTVLVRLRNDNRLRYFDCWLQAIVNRGQPALVSGWARDVTAQYESEIRFTELFESLREGVYFATLSGQILDANQAMVRLLGYGSKEELKAQNMRELYQNPAERDLLIREIESKGAFHDRELRLRGKDSQGVYCLASGFAIRDTFGRIARLQGSLTDITERRGIERQLHKEQEFVRRLVASFPDLIAVLDRAGRFTFVGQNVRDILGGTAEEYLGERLDARADPEDKRKVADAVHNAVSGKESSAQIEFRCRTDDGSRKILRATIGPLFDETGKITGVVASARDVTQSKLIEQELAQKEKFAAIGQMMTGAAHELNNPLTAILGVGELLRERAAGGDARRHAELILQQARKAAGIVENLLALTRAPAQRRSKVHVDKIIQGVLEATREALRQRNISVKFEAPEDFPPTEGDEKQLAQVFLNLIANSEQAISDRGRGNLSISLSRTGDRLCAILADDGPGIPPENIAKIFDPFFTTKRPGGGSGLGLAICVAIVKEHGGTIDVESTPGSGASFRILLPIEPALAKPERHAPAPRKAMAQPDPLSGHTALVVDDEESIREIVQEALLARGMEVGTAASSEEALSRLAEKAYEIVICDFNLPGMSGRQLFKRLREGRNEPPPRFVFITGDLADPNLASELSRNGAYVMQKPFQVKDLAKLLAEILQFQPTRMD